MGCCTSATPFIPASSPLRGFLYPSAEPQISQKSPPKLPISPHVHYGPLSESYSIQRKLGSGAFGTVYEAVHIASGFKCALKVVERALLNSQELRAICEEITILRALGDCGNILRLLDAVVGEDSIVIVTELCTGGCLLKLVEHNKGISEEKAARYLRQVLSAVAFCHKRHIVHRDIKLENLLLETPGSSSVKLIDFGAATHLVGSKPLTKPIGTVSATQPYYMAPEVLSMHYDEKCDVWSCGVLLYMLLAAAPPFPGQSEMEIFTKIRKGRFNLTGTFHADGIWTSISSSAKDFVSQMLTADPLDRPSAAQLLTHPWLQCAGQEEGKRETPSFLNYLASQLSTFQEAERLRQKLVAMDEDQDGLLSRAEILRHLPDLPLLNPLDPSAVKETLDTDFVDYSAFISETMDWREALTPAAFRRNEGKRHCSWRDRPDTTWQEVVRNAERRRSIQDHLIRPM